MTTYKYIGMNRNTGLHIDDIDHIRQSIADILITPVGSRVMRRAYGSLLSELIAQPQNPALRLQIMAASYSAILRWEPRVKLTGITFDTTFDGKMVVDITGTRSDSAAPLSLTIPVS
ncbi:GPW/gp25 family protein [Yersinia enterocolitica]|uniref:GPW/gp25 family protein n=1 Tax=Yersinia enterocolitica TaxID=630 RepID=UPI0005E709D5|nr:GPW/gp25 family protein [Yersinia enterocolitica]CND43210.1 phage baseplate assembly protein [Yersinia enterocolitica]CQI25787.1 phage baseplate assembly protein [Yersinia enterocolitica]